MFLKVLTSYEYFFMCVCVCEMHMKIFDHLSLSVKWVGI